MSETKGTYPAPEKRNRSIKIRVTDDELEIMKMHSTRSELARWIRETCLSGGQQDFIKQANKNAIDPELLRGLSGIGNNLNQIARRVNSGEWGALDKVQIIAALAGVERALTDLRNNQK
jgi:hypothetical protein